MDLRQRFNNLFYLRKAIKWDEEKIKSIEDSLQASTQKITGMPVVHNNTDTMADRIVEMISLREKVECEKLALIREERYLFEYVANLEDKKISMLLRLRYFDKKTWPQISWMMGKNDTVDSCRMAVKRFFSGEAGE